MSTPADRNRGVVIHLIAPESGETTPHDDSFVVDYQPEFWAGSSAAEQHFLVTTKDVAKARVFPSIVEAHAYWAQTPPAPHDVRADGKPNRPLTGFTVVMEPVTIEVAR